MDYLQASFVTSFVTMRRMLKIGYLRSAAAELQDEERDKRMAVKRLHLAVVSIIR